MAAVKPAGPEPSTATRVEMLLLMPSHLGRAMPPRNAAAGEMLDCPAAGDEVPDQHDDADHQQDMDQRAGGMEREETERPQNEQDDRDGEKHAFLRLWFGPE